MLNIFKNYLGLNLPANLLFRDYSMLNKFKVDFGFTLADTDTTTLIKLSAQSLTYS